jgi:amino acid transporter
LLAAVLLLLALCVLLLAAVLLLLPLLLIFCVPLFLLVFLLGVLLLAIVLLIGLLSVAKGADSEKHCEQNCRNDDPDSFHGVTSLQTPKLTTVLKTSLWQYSINVPLAACSAV